MRSLCAAFLVALLATLAGAEEITADKVLAAYGLGAPVDNIIAQINNPANTVAFVSAADLARLKAASVPDAVVQAMVARAPMPTPTPAPSLPDDPRLESVVKLVKSGLSESIIADQIKKSGTAYNLTVNDLLYLRTNQVPESIIGALIAAPPATAVQSVTVPTASGVKPLTGEVEVGGLIMKKATFMVKDRVGKLIFKGDEITWVDSDQPSKNVALRASGITKAWVRCQPRPQTPFCYEIGFEIFKGDSYKFQDAKLEKGVNDQVLMVRQVFKEHYPNVLISERLDD